MFTICKNVIALALSIILLCLVSSPLWAEEGQALVSGPPITEGATERLTEPENQIETVWKNSQKLLSAGELQGANEALLALNDLRKEKGLDSLEEYSLYLIARGEEQAHARDVDSATFLLRRALDLSPLSPLVALKAISLSRSTGYSSPAGLLMLAVNNLSSHFGMVIGLANGGLYSALLALSMALYLTLVVFIAHQMLTLLRRVSRKLPISARGFLTPLAASIILGLPFYFGPLWTIAAWSLLVLMFVPERKWLAFCGGLVLVLWGTIVTLRENTALWLDDPGIKSALRVVSNSYAHWDKALLLDLTERRLDDPFGFYSLGELLLRDGDFPRAKLAFERASELMGDDSWGLAQLGVISLLDGHLKEADKLFSEAEAKGLSSAEFLFNVSKVKFELGDSGAGREYFDRAQKINRELVLELRDREARFGIRNPHAIAVVKLPFKWVVHSALSANAAAGERADQILAVLGKGLNSPLLAGLGALLIVLFFLRSERVGKRRIQNYFVDYEPSAALIVLIKLIPGGAWIIGGNPGVGFATLATLLLCAMPLFGWPLELQAFAASMGAFRAHFLFIFILTSICIVYAGFYKDREVLHA